MKKDIVSVKDLFDLTKRYFKLLQKKWYIVLLSVVFFVAIGIIVSFVYKTRYKAKLTFVLQESQSPASSSLGSLASMASQFGIASPSVSSAFNEDNICEILKSKNIVCKALLAKNDFFPNAKSQKTKDYLINYYLYFNDYYKTWKNNKSLRNFKFTNYDFRFSSDSPIVNRTSYILHRRQDSILNIIYKTIVTKNLDVDKLKPGLDIILIKVQSIDETFSKLFAENLVKAVTEFYISTKTQRAEETLLFFQNRADSTKNALDDVQLELAKWQDAKNQLVKFEGQVDRAKLLRKVEILNTVYAQILTNLEISKMNLLNIKPLIKIIDSPILPLDVFMIPLRYAIIVGVALGIFISCLILFIRMILLEALHKDDELIIND